MDRIREVEAGHGRFKAMGFKWRARIEGRVRRTWFGLGYDLAEWRYVLEKYHMSWEDVAWGPWTTETEATAAASARLDSIEEKPQWKYVTYATE